MYKVTLESLLTDSIALKHLPNAGFRHAVQTAENAFKLAIERGICPDLATKAGLLHDIGHTNWEEHGEWDYESYNYFDIHPIKGAERAHELLTLKGEHLGKAREIALAILFHSGSSPITRNIELTPLQRLIMEADDLDAREGGKHHNLEISFEKALEKVKNLDRLVQDEIKDCDDNCESCHRR
ncbi:HD domain-containing protein [Halothermothrix orenii]|uniref:Metal dependent phosphohydrolase n=1 Tax=Halothermothrix orenii (strain H 168 / OCM 544 / DSM 9562) TaxID=373903 RepID=B8CW63_HALOH|nr:HD domain-containing protein [Halothermothrix orenii]ACL69532.1 metal dependent phosphohydrolase [Halothermothrix orenii H 168]